MVPGLGRLGSAAVARDRTALVTGGVLILAALAAWAGLLVQADTPMPGAGSLEAVAFLSAWGIMMAAMMLPSATPMIALYAATRRNETPGGPGGVSTAVFAAIYLAVWVAFGVPVYAASVLVGMQPGVDDILPYALGVVLVAAGVYQFTPLKRACLRVCRNPLSFLLTHARTGYRGTLGLGLEHAAYCVGCCWGLMVVLVAAGAMALNWVLLIAAVVFVEKVLPRGEASAWLVGGGLVLLGLAIVLDPPLAMLLHPASMDM
jgi:predicted metal-binding membrane protein